MKIAFVYDLIYPYSKGGVEKRIWDLSHLLAVRGHEVHVLGTKYWDGEPELLRDGIHYRGICSPVEIHAKEGRRSIWQAARFAFSVGRSLTRSQFDIVDVQGMAPLTCLVTLAVSRFTRNIPVVTWYEVWRGYWHEYLGPLGYVGRLVEWLVARWAPVHAAVSRLAIARLKGLGVEEVSLLPIGIDYRGIQSVPPDSLKSEILYVGRLARHKNLGLLIDAITLLKDEGLDPSVLIVGEGPEREMLERRAVSGGLDNVRFLGRVESDDRIIALMKATRVFAFPSLREGYGLAPLEALACGAPVVAVAHADNATFELIEDHVTGILTSSEAGEFARALKVILLDQELRDHMGRSAMKSAESFDWSLMVDDVEHVYLEAFESLSVRGVEAHSSLSASP